MNMPGAIGGSIPRSCGWTRVPVWKAASRCCSANCCPDALTSSGAAKAGDHLVGDQQHVVTVADLAQPGEIGGWRHDDTAGTHDRLGDDRRNSVRAFSEDRLLDRIGRPSP